LFDRYETAWEDVDNVIIGINALINSNLQPEAYQTGSIFSFGWFGFLGLSDDAADYIYQSFRMANGEWNYQAVQRLLGRGESILPHEYDALKRLFADPTLDYEDILRMCESNTISYPGSTVVIRRLGEDFSRDATALAESLSQKGGWGNLTEKEKCELSDSLKLAQLLVFLGHVDFIDPAVFDLSNATQLADPDGIVYEGFSSQEGGVIVYQGEAYQISDADQFLLALPSIRSRDEATSAFNVAVPTSAQETALDILSGGLGKVTGLEDTISLIKLGHDIYDVYNDSVAYTEDVNNAYAEYAFRTYATTTEQLGGGVGYVQTPDGYRPIGFNLATPDVVKALVDIEVYLDSSGEFGGHDYTRDEILKILFDPRATEHKDITERLDRGLK
jgi:hypothetical protein